MTHSRFVFIQSIILFLAKIESESQAEHGDLVSCVNVCEFEYKKVFTAKLIRSEPLLIRVDYNNINLKTEFFKSEFGFNSYLSRISYHINQKELEKRNG